MNRLLSTNCRAAPRASRNRWKAASARVVSLALLIAMASIVPSARAASDEPNADAITVFRCGFQQDWDQNYDHWPDRWERKVGVEYPHYVDIEIHDDDTAPNGRCLRIALDGASAEIASPPIPVSPLFGYVLEAQVKAIDLRFASTTVTLDLCDKSGAVLQTAQGLLGSTSDGWQTIRVPVEPNHSAIDHAIVRLRVLRGAKPDLDGRVMLANVWIARRPQIKISTNSPCNVYYGPGDVLVKCELSGITEQHPAIHFELRDAAQHKLQESTSRLTGKLIVESSPTLAQLGSSATPSGYEAFAQWRPKLPAPGLYCVVVKMVGSTIPGINAGAEPEFDSRTIWLALLPPLDVPLSGDFGWSLGARENPLSLAELARLLPQAGVSWVKLPLWFEPSDTERANELIRFVELLGASKVEVVGVIDQSFTSAKIDGLTEQSNGQLSIADLFALDPSFWSPVLDPIMTRLALRVRWWQLGRDDDTSFVGLPSLNNHIRDLRSRLFRFGQEVKLGLAWDWKAASQMTGEVAWDFEQLSTDVGTDEAAEHKFLAQAKSNSALRWVLVRPPRTKADSLKSQQSIESLASEFVHRLVAVKESGVDGIFLANPFNDALGVMRSDGTPGLLLLPWRTTSIMLGGSRYLGQMELPAGSKNRIFVRPDGQVVMVVWNPNPCEETLFLGENIRQYDLWGTEIRAKASPDEQTIKVSQSPSFVLGLHEPIARWRMSLAFKQKQVPSIFSVPHGNSLAFENFFPQGVGGTYSIVVPQTPNRQSQPSAHSFSGFVPDRWIIEPPRGSFRLAPGEKSEIPFEIRLKNAMFGQQPIRIDFTVEAEKPYHFSVYRHLEVGTDELNLKINTHIDRGGALIVEQLMSSHAERLADFKCNLYAKGHRRQRAQVFRLGSKLDRKLYRFANGEELLGAELLLEIEEQNGPRVIKYRFIATDNPTSNDNETQDDEGAPRDNSAPHDSDAESTDITT